MFTLFDKNCFATIQFMSLSSICYFTKASGGILFCLNSSENTKPARWKSQLVSSKHFRLQSTFMLLCCDIVCIICIFVASLGPEEPAICGWLVGVIVDWAIIGALKAFLVWKTEALLMCSSSFIMQKPPLLGTMTRVFWNIRTYSDLGLEFRSLKRPVTVRTIICGYGDENNSWWFHEIRVEFEGTVTLVWKF